MVAKKGDLMTVIPLDSELAPGTLKAILGQVRISKEQFEEEWR